MGRLSLHSGFDHAHQAHRQPRLRAVHAPRRARVRCAPSRSGGQPIPRAHQWNRFRALGTHFVQARTSLQAAGSLLTQSRCARSTASTSPSAVCQSAGIHPEVSPRSPHCHWAACATCHFAVVMGWRHVYSSSLHLHTRPRNRRINRHQFPWLRFAGRPHITESFGRAPLVGRTARGL